ncbi:MAG: hypothetical protein ACEQSB_06975 [Undibacterium sp.]
MNKSLPRDPRVVRISSALKADRLRTVGGLLSAWCLFDEQTEDGKLEGYTPELMDEIVGFQGLARAMESVGWLEVSDGFLVVPRFEEHNGQSAKRRAQDSDRKMSARKADKCPQVKRTKSGLEKNREEKSNIPPTPQGGDGHELFGETNIDHKDRYLPKDWRKISKADQKKTKVLRNSLSMIQIGAWFDRKSETLWTVAEAAALMMIRPTQSEIDGMGIYYSAQIMADDDIRRRDLGTLLNNWSGELDRARKFVNSQAA